ncbi:hypothetical protein BS78_04G234200 [Paspalum vaginatum]|nr:hypothetical protein BS78_04G234200 [Paspalum vaginatum]KAJ1280460.1 hypothetical protein BS78_04G234200 [Paspalum vaginatum]KAJ1280461.1 hypothetical protein BS78_04G234200 [Paspalum vaginatum]
MRCRKHPYQAGGGVCATCLRDRLLALAAARNGGAPSPPEPAQAAPPAAPAPEPIAFPRSVSPYVSRRKSDSTWGGAGSRHHHHHPGLLFFRTPQVGALEEGDIGYEYEKRRAGKFSLLATLFGHHHHRSEQGGGAATQRSKKHSWFAGIMPRRRKKQAAATASPPPPRRSSCRVVSNRGLSPERDSRGSGDESSSPAADPPWRPSPSPMRRRRQTNSMPSGFAVCLSPLVRPSPSRHRHHVAQPPEPGTFSCELRPSPLHSLSSAATVTRCRSRKLADGGRFR